MSESCQRLSVSYGPLCAIRNKHSWAAKVAMRQTLPGFSATASLPQLFTGKTERVVPLYSMLVVRQSQDD